MIKVFYIVPQDFDSVDTPNCFTVPGPDQPLTLGKLKQHFPLPGLYRFRLGFRHKGRIYWMDIHDEAEPLPPMENGEYMVKASRLPSRVTPPVECTSAAADKAAAEKAAAQKRSELDDSFFL